MRALLLDESLDGPIIGACPTAKDKQIEYLNLRIEAMDKELRRLRRLKNAS